MTTPEVVKEIVREKFVNTKNPRTPRPNAPNIANTKVEKLSKQLASANERNKLLTSELRSAKTVTRAVKNFKNVPAISKAAAFPSQMSEDFVKDDFLSHGHSKYLNSLLVPEDGPVTIPDQVLKMHTLKTETVTYQINMTDPGDPSNATTAISGLIMLYPNHPTELIGFVFIRDVASGLYVSVNKLTTAQQLYLSFDYGCRTSQIVKIQSSTLLVVFML